jgi:hypothetical protein
VAEKDELTEQLRYFTEMLRLVWLTLLAVGSGTVGLLLGDLTLRRVIFASVGVVVMGVLIAVIEHLRRQIWQTIPQLRRV